MKKLLAILVLLAVIAGLFLMLRPKNPHAELPTNEIAATPRSSNAPIVRIKPPNAPQIVTTGSVTNVSVTTDLASRAASPNVAPDAGANTNESPALPPLIALDKARVLIHNYHAAFGENPVGANPEIAAALQGKNPKQINFLADSGLRLDGKGDLVDGYGTPFFFHQISGNEMEIRSAGPDKIMWTSDDSVTR